MGKAYSYDLRQKVIHAIQLDGMRKSEAAQIFQLSRNTIDLWLKRQASTGAYQADPIAPIALQHSLSFVTRNENDFAETNVEIVNPWLV